MRIRIFFPASIPLADQDRFCESLPGQIAGLSVIMKRQEGREDPPLDRDAILVERFSFIGGKHARITRATCESVPSEAEAGFDIVSYVGRALAAFSRGRWSLLVVEAENPKHRFALTRAEDMAA